MVTITQVRINDHMDDIDDPLGQADDDGMPAPDAGYREDLIVSREEYQKLRDERDWYITQIIGLWHDEVHSSRKNDKRLVYEWLGWTLDEYAKWVETGETPDVG